MLDHYGLPLTTRSQAARDAYVAAVGILLAAGPGSIEAFEAVVRADDSFALGHAGLARACHMAGLGRRARDAIGTAEGLLGGTTRREQAHVATLALSMRGQAEAARLGAMAHAREYPRDVMITATLMGVFSLLGFSGRPGREAENLSFTESLAPDFGEDGWFLAQLAFAQLEMGLCDAALPNVDRALELAPRNANAAHIRAHLYYETGETEAGLGFLTGWMRDYDRAGMLHCHNSWHLALWSLLTGDEAAMWARVDEDLSPDVSQSPALNIMTDLAALYARAEWAGVAVPEARWADVSAFASKVFPRPGLQFADLHAALAHAMAGNGEALARVIRDAAGPAADIVRPVAEAFGAMASGHWAQALRHLTPVVGQHARFGGSRAQRDLIDFAYAITLLRLGKGDEAARHLHMRRAGTDYLAGLPELRAESEAILA